MLDDAAPPTAAALPRPEAEAFVTLSELLLVLLFEPDLSMPTVTVLVFVLVLLSVNVRELLSFAWIAFEYSFADAPDPLCVEVAVAL
ncbi:MULTISPECIES: hypothetical protein [unclassified Cupriavidus]|uniref:hypothetical protein n=1 Tax=unclassified Cupriavidus TaxID=2640874 RepID=UPI00295F1495|nr:hypothetical protein [Cupriavidus sp. TA19]